jgi:two-component system, NtrC family, C4-dicarboxylate transport sensor histidine kinase DctB
MAVRKDWPILANLLEKGLEAITWKGHQSIRQRWLWVRYEHGITSADVWRWILRIVGGAVLLLLLVLVWNRMLRREVKKAEAQLVQAGKLAVLGELGAGIAHELNQPITAIRGFAELILSEKNGLEPEMIDLVDRIYNATYRMSYIVDNVRSFARQSSFKPDPSDALKPLVAAVDLIAEQLRLHEITIEKDFAEDLPEAMCDSNQLQQVFLNLLGNARDALDTLPTGQKKQIRLRVQTQNSFLEYTVEDNGPGVDEKNRSRIFEPFFTTKPEGRGMGIGLSLSSRIIKNHGGKISCEPIAEGGTRFLIDIPAAH